VNRPEEINEIFDTISYAKGASVIRMLSSYLGADVLFKGLHLYLTRHMYGNASTDDLWRAFEETSGKNVRAASAARVDARQAVLTAVPCSRQAPPNRPGQVTTLMRQWTRQVGYPVLTLPDDLAKPVAQQRFLTSGEQGEGHWLLPLSVLVGDDLQRVDLGMIGTDVDYARVSAWLREHQGQLIKLNAGQTGFFRVNYNSSLWAAILRDWLRLPLVDRLGVLADSMRLWSLRSSKLHCGFMIIKRQRVMMRTVTQHLRWPRPVKCRWRGCWTCWWRTARTERWSHGKKLRCT